MRERNTLNYSNNNLFPKSIIHLSYKRNSKTTIFPLLAKINQENKIDPIGPITTEKKWIYELKWSGPWRYEFDSWSINKLFCAHRGEIIALEIEAPRENFPQQRREGKPIKNRTIYCSGIRSLSAYTSPSGSLLLFRLFRVRYGLKVLPKKMVYILQMNELLNSNPRNHLIDERWLNDQNKA